MGRDRFIGTVSAAAFGLVLAACSGSEQETQPTSSPDAVNTLPPTVRFTETPRDLVTFTSVPRATGTPLPRITPTPSGGPAEALKTDGLQDWLEVDSLGIFLSSNFKIEAKIKLDQESLVSGGDTVVSKGDNFAAFARTLSTRCLGRVGALIDGEDICTDKVLAANTWYSYEMTFDGRELIISVDGERVGGKDIQGPLQVSPRNLIVGARPGINRAPLAGLTGDLKITDNGKVVFALDLKNGFSDSSGQNRRVITHGDPKVSR